MKERPSSRPLIWHVSAAVSILVAFLVIAERLRPGSVMAYVHLPVLIFVAGALACAVPAETVRRKRGDLFLRLGIGLVCSIALFFVIAERGWSGGLLWAAATLCFGALILYSSEDL